MIATVIPDVPSFSVDAGFRYLIPDRFVARVTFGSRVRVPLGGRRVGGTVIHLTRQDDEDSDDPRLREIVGVSGSAPVLDERLLAVLRWAAQHYVAPVSVLLSKSIPPNVPPGPGRGLGSTPRSGMAGVPNVGVPTGNVSNASTGSKFVAEIVAAVQESISGARTRPLVWLGSRDHAEWIVPAYQTVRAAGKSMLVVVSTTSEVQAMSEAVQHHVGPVVVVDSDMDDAAVTNAWRTATHSGGLILGTPRIVAWDVAELAAVAIVEDSRRAMKDRQTPTVHVREMLRARAQRDGLALIVAGATPSLEALAWGPKIVRPTRRAWPFVEIVDRRDDPPGSGVIARTSMTAIRTVARNGGSVFVYAHRRGYSAAARCVACRTLRRCAACGSRPDPGDHCRRCGATLTPCTECGGGRFEPLGAGVGRLVDEIARVVGREQVAPHPDSTTVTVGTERDLVGLGLQDLVVMSDLDGLLFAPNYRAAEDALRIGARLAGTLRPASGRRLIVQTSDPAHHAVDALRSGDPLRFADVELGHRSSLGYPPTRSLIVVEARGGDDVQIKQVDADLASLSGATVMGPATSRDGTRWLVQGQDLTKAKTALRGHVQRWRDSKLTIRVDVDPIDL